MLRTIFQFGENVLMEHAIWNAIIKVHITGSVSTWRKIHAMNFVWFPTGVRLFLFLLFPIDFCLCAVSFAFWMTVKRFFRSFSLSLEKGMKIKLYESEHCYSKNV